MRIEKKCCLTSAIFLICVLSSSTVAADSGLFPTGYDNSSGVMFYPDERLVIAVHDFVDAEWYPTEVIFTKIDADNYSILNTYTIPGQAATDFVFLPSEDMLYFLNLASRALVEYDCGTQQITRSVSVDSIPNCISLSPDSSSIFVTTGEYPRWDGDYDDPETWNQRRGKLVKYERNTLSVLASQTCYSGPLFPKINVEGTRLYLGNSVRIVEKGPPPEEWPADRYYKIEVFDPSDLSFLREFEVGYPLIGFSDQDKALISGYTEYDHKPMLLDMTLDTTTDFDDSSLGEHADMESDLSFSPSINKGYVLTNMAENEPPCSIAVVDLNTMQVTPHVLGVSYYFHRLFVDETGGQLILWASREDGLYSVSPIP